MTIRFAMLSCLAAACLLAQAPSTPQPMPKSSILKVGDMAPDFTLPATNGQQVKLSDFRGKKTVVLAFFPAAFTGGCTKEMQAYQLGADKYQSADTQVYGISTDNTPSLKVFAEQLKLAFPLLSDFKDRSTAKAYGILMADRGLANRVTFVVDREGKISYMEGGQEAVALTGVGEACSRLANKKSE